jgi:hypothetical protein
LALLFIRPSTLKPEEQEMIAWHQKENDQRTFPVLKEAKNMLDELTGRKPVQMSLFGL